VDPNVISMRTLSLVAGASCTREKEFSGDGSTPREFAALSLDGNGVIRDCTVGAARLLGYSARELPGRLVSHLLPEVGRKLGEGGSLSRFAFLCRCGVLHQATTANGERFLAALSIVQLRNPGVAPLLLVIEKVEREAVCRFLTVAGLNNDRSDLPLSDRQPIVRRLRLSRRATRRDMNADAACGREGRGRPVGALAKERRHGT